MRKAPFARKRPQVDFIVIIRGVFTAPYQEAFGCLVSVNSSINRCDSLDAGISLSQID